MQRFSRIKTDVNKFCGYLVQVESLNGYTADDKIERAKEIFSKFEKPNKSSKPAMFAFEHCWRVLKNDQKCISTTSKKKSTSLNVQANGSSPLYVGVEFFVVAVGLIVKISSCKNGCYRQVYEKLML